MDQAMLYIEYPLPICLWGYFIIIEVLMKIKYHLGEALFTPYQ